MSKELTPLEKFIELKTNLQTLGISSSYYKDIETALKELNERRAMMKKINFSCEPEIHNVSKELLIDLLVYLDTQLNLNEETIPHSEYSKAIKIVAHLNEKHNDFGNAEKRHILVCYVIDNL